MAMHPLPDPEDGEEPSGGPASGPKSGRNLPIAIVTGLILAGLIFTTVFTSLPAWTALVTAAVLVAQYELYAVLAKVRGLRPAAALGYAATIVILFGTAWRGIDTASFAVVGALLVAFLWYLVDPEREKVTENLAATMFSIAYLPLFAAHVVAITRLPHGPALTMAWLGATVFTDIGGFAFGSLFGKHKMAPRISPGKSWEGFAGGTLLVLLLGFTVGPLFPGLDLRTAAGLAAIVVLAAPLGDLAESLLKRDLGVKDMGGLLPGHGGMLDRIDALLFVAPFAYWFLAATR